MVMSHPYPVGTTAAGDVYIIYGRSRASWSSALTSYNGSSAVVDLNAELTATPNLRHRLLPRRLGQLSLLPGTSPSPAVISTATARRI